MTILSEQKINKNFFSLFQTFSIAGRKAKNAIHFVPLTSCKVTLMIVQERRVKRRNFFSPPPNEVRMVNHKKNPKKSKSIFHHHRVFVVPTDHQLFTFNPPWREVNIQAEHKKHIDSIISNFSSLLEDLKYLK